MLLLLDIFDFILFVFKVTGNCSASAFRPEQKYVAASDDPFKWDARCHLEHLFPEKTPWSICASMSQEPESPVPSKEPEEDLGELTDEDNIEDESTSEEAAQDPMEPSEPKTERPNSVAVREILGEEMEDSKAAFDEAPVDWFEPLEEDAEFDGIGKKDPEEESVAGESERSESVYGSEKAYKTVFQ